METIQKIWNKKFVLLFITNLLVLAAFYASIPIIPVYCQEIGITGSGIGIVLTAMSVATILFRPIAGYLLDNFNRYRVYLLFLALFCLAFPSFIAFPIFGALIVIRLYMGAVYSVCGSATMTLASDVLPPYENYGRHQQICIYHFHRHGSRPLCRHSGAEPLGQQSIFPDSLCHFRHCFDLRILLQNQISKSKTKKILHQRFHL